MIMVLMVLLQGRAGLRDLVRIDINGWLVASFSTLAMIAFIPALQLTDVSNVAIIIATGPFLAAGLAWIWLQGRSPIGEPCWRAPWRLSASSSSSAAPAAVLTFSALPSPSSWRWRSRR